MDVFWTLRTTKSESAREILEILGNTVTYKCWNPAVAPSRADQPPIHRRPQHTWRLHLRRWTRHCNLLIEPFLVPSASSPRARDIQANRNTLKSAASQVLTPHRFTNDYTSPLTRRHPLHALLYPPFMLMFVEWTSHCY